jgi:AcrR family transcriptional regulator
MLGEAKRDRRAERREATKAEILDAAWDVARDEGLAALSLRDVARRVGMQAPSLYGYFDSKMAIYDAMFAQGSQAFADAEPWQQMTGDARHDVKVAVRSYVEFCVADHARYQLLFQRTIPGFEPSAESYAIAERSLERFQEHLAQCGLTDPRALDMFTALTAGLADQQIANDPHGDRWLRLVDDMVDMFVDHLETSAKPSRSRKKVG